MSFPIYKAAKEQRSQAIKQNREALRKEMDNLAETHRGQYALMRDGKIVDFYKSAGDALQDAMRKYPDDARYSVEKIEPEPIYMGMYADVVVGTRS